MASQPSYFRSVARSQALSNDVSGSTMNKLPVAVVTDVCDVGIVTTAVRGASILSWIGTVDDSGTFWDEVGCCAAGISDDRRGSSRISFSQLLEYTTAAKASRSRTCSISLWYSLGRPWPMTCACFV